MFLGLVCLSNIYILYELVLFNGLVITACNVNNYFQIGIEIERSEQLPFCLKETFMKAVRRWDEMARTKRTDMKKKKEKQI